MERTEQTGFSISGVKRIAPASSSSSTGATIARINTESAFAGIRTNEVLISERVCKRISDVELMLHCRQLSEDVKMERVGREGCSLLQRPHIMASLCRLS